jgi:hypothetical protein
LPIHSTWNYRNSHVSQIESISRRWLFNIPRSQKTEGLRALGRVALLDHAERVKSQFRKAILAATAQEAILATAAATGLEFVNCDPRVIVVASPGGGTGSGMLIDAAYAMRQMLIETGFSDDQVIGILALASRQNRTTRDLAPANALACLRELQFYSIAGDYPGEIACGLAGFREELPTFAQTYFVDLGEQLAGEAFSEAANKVASYIVLSTVTAAGPFFDLVRGRTTEPTGDIPIRSIAIESLATDSLDVSSKLVDELCRTVVLHWRGIGASAGLSGTRAAASSPIRTDTNPASLADKQANETYLNRLASEHAAEIGLDPRMLFKAIAQLVENEGQVSTAKVINDIVAEAMSTTGATRELAGSALVPVLQQIHRYSGSATPSDGELKLDRQTLREAQLESAQRHGKALGAPLEDWILGLVDRSECRVAGAQQIAGWLKARLHTLTEDGAIQLKQARQAREQMFAELTGQSRTSGSPQRPKGFSVADDLRRYAHLLVQEATLEAVLKCVATLEGFVCRASDRLRDLWKDLNRLADEFVATSASNSEAADDDASAIASNEMADDARDEIERSFVKNRCSLGAILSRGSELRPQLVTALREAAKKVVRKAGRESALKRLAGALSRGEGVDRILEKRLASLEHAAGRFGGSMRLLISLPDKSLAAPIAARVTQEVGEAPTLVTDPKGEMIAVYEIEQVPFTAIANRLIRSKPDCESLASRLHTRTDINFGTM